MIADQMMSYFMI